MNSRVMTWASVLVLSLIMTGCSRNSVTSADGVRIEYEVHGEGSPALIFVHGWSCDRSYWNAQLEPFSREYKVVTLDLAGHGDSGRDRQAWTMAAYGEDVAAVVKEIGLDRVVLIGHSMGGDVIVEAARRLPGRVVGLVWVDTYRQLNTFRTAGERQTMVAPFRANFVDTTREFVRGMFPPNADKALVEKVALDMSSAPQKVALGSMESAIGYDEQVPPALQELKLPVVALNAGYRPTDRDSLKRHGIEVVEMPNVGHFLMMEDPARFNPLLKSVVDKLAGPANP